MTHDPSRPHGIVIRERYVAIALLIGVALYFTYRSPRTLMLDSSCAPRGATARWIAKAQGDAFWQSQLAYVDARIARPAERQMARAQVAATLDSFRAETHTLLDSIRAAHPGVLRERSKSEQLRRAADSIDAAETHAFIEGLDEALATAYASCREVVAAKAGIRF